MVSFLNFSQVGQGTANEVELLDLREELERKEEKHEQEKGRKKDTAQGVVLRCVALRPGTLD